MRLALLCLAVFTTACSTGDSYLLNRGGDLADILRFKGMAGKGVGVEVEATRLLHLGGVYADDVHAAGLHDRELSTWRESIRSWGLILGHHQETVTGIARYSGSYGWDFSGEGPGDFTSAAPDNPLDLITFRGTLMLGLGLDLSVRVGEAIDFVVGIFQFDPAGDDRTYGN